jgi:hypothetical protein
MHSAAGSLQSVAQCACCFLLTEQVNLPDDRVIIVSGFLDDPVRQSGKPAPSIDVFDYKSRR